MPLLRQHAVSIVASQTFRRRQLVANPSWLCRAIPRGGLEQHIPPRKQNAEVAPITRAFVTITNRMMAPMKRWAHQQAVKERHHWQVRIHMLDALQHVANRHQHHGRRPTTTSVVDCDEPRAAPTRRQSDVANGDTSSRQNPGPPDRSGTTRPVDRSRRAKRCRCQYSVCRRSQSGFAND
jgi:hypothetical protein